MSAAPAEVEPAVVRVGNPSDPMPAGFLDHVTYYDAHTAGVNLGRDRLMEVMHRLHDLAESTSDRSTRIAFREMTRADYPDVFAAFDEHIVRVRKEVGDLLDRELG